MGLFLIILAAYLAALSLYKPLPISLHSRLSTYKENIGRVKASLSVGAGLLVIFFITSGFGFQEIDQRALTFLTLTNSLELFKVWPVPVVTHLFVHADLVHVLANVVTIGALSAYERRVGAKRFLVILLVGCIASIPSIFFFDEGTRVMGISGGALGLAAAYFTDYEKLKVKQWLNAIMLFAFLAIMFSFLGGVESASEEGMQYQTDHLGHIFGALGAIIYCRVRPQKKESKPALA